MQLPEEARLDASAFFFASKFSQAFEKRMNDDDSSVQTVNSG